MAHIATCVLVMCSVVAAGQVPSTEHRESELSMQEYAVYAAVTIQIFWKADTRIALVDGNTVAAELPPKFQAYLSGHFTALEKSTIDDLRSKPDAVLQLRFPLNRDYRIVEGQKVSFGETVGGRPDYPNSTGVLSFSRVGFNSDKSQAWVFVRQHCGGFCGLDVWVLLLRQQDGNWQVTKKLITGAS